EGRLGILPSVGRTDVVGEPLYRKLYATICVLPRPERSLLHGLFQLVALSPHFVVRLYRALMASRDGAPPHWASLARAAVASWRQERTTSSKIRGGRPWPCHSAKRSRARPCAPFPP